MTQEVAMWLIGIVVAILTLVMGWIFTELISSGKVIVKLSTSHEESSRRLIRVEGILDGMGKRSAKVLHSPHTPGLDRLLEKYDDDSITIQEAKMLMEMLEDIESNAELPKGERMAAVGVLPFIQDICRMGIRKLI